MAKSRTEIDKDMMYRKIMPSTVRNGKKFAGSQAEELTTHPVNKDTAKTENKSTAEIENITFTQQTEYTQ